jgi:hypothetical protein
VFEKAARGLIAFQKVIQSEKQLIIASEDVHITSKYIKTGQ